MKQKIRQAIHTRWTLYCILSEQIDGAIYEENSLQTSTLNFCVFSLYILHGRKEEIALQEFFINRKFLANTTLK
jgi:hypothetical protein